MINNYVKKPVVIQAVKWDGYNFDEIHAFTGEACYKLSDAFCEAYGYSTGNYLWCETLEGGYIVSIGDYIIRGVAGEFYPCKPHIFEQTYNKVE